MLTWIYASYKFHPDIKSHIGRCNVSWMGLNPLQITKTETEQKKSTEAEVVGLSDYVMFNIFKRIFMESQGYSLKQNVVHK